MRRRGFNRAFRKKEEEEPSEATLENSAFRLTPIELFTVKADCYYQDRFSKNPGPLAKKYQLSSLADLCNEEQMANFFFAWHQEGLYFSVDVKRGVERCLYPEIRSGDSIELFIDTRDNKNAGCNHRFCHHFFFLPRETNGVTAGEITRFRTEDTHDWCESTDLVVLSELHENSYSLYIFIPSHCLQGYDPDHFDRLGFTYRINSPAATQHFSVSSCDYAVDQQPSLWASVKLVDKT